MKSILFILSQPPHGTSSAREALDAILAASAVTDEISILFSGDGVWQLVGGQNPQAIGQRHIEPTYGMLDLYDIQSIYLDGNALAARALDANALILKGDVLSAQQQQALLHRHSIILRF
ncbi:sulfurtransferase complex subunit TusC [Celerinatantimonas sp. YJH-8]|uniref:sulfurtransferase complex subunit TusC n=1 Tax=Celerinatantimonas sp. YJH-8 TaxID=3228714 RepID=UPI0038C0303C